MKYRNYRKEAVFCNICSCVIDSIGYLGGYMNKRNEYLRIDNKTIENRTFYKECFCQTVITNTTFRNCTFFCVETCLDTMFENCVFENCRFINCVVKRAYVRNVAFFKCNMFDSVISTIDSTKISGVWRIGCKTTYRQLKGYEEMFL